jgi:hypothetical protein
LQAGLEAGRERLCAARAIGIAALGDESGGGAALRGASWLRATAAARVVGAEEGPEPEGCAAMGPGTREDAEAAAAAARAKAATDERRRSSFALVLPEQGLEGGRLERQLPGHTLAVALGRQARHTANALVLAALCAPLVLAVEPLARLLPGAFAIVPYSAPCEGLRMDQRNVVDVTVALIATVTSGLSVAIVVAATVPGFPRVMPHCSLAVVTAVAYCCWYARGVDAVSGTAAILYGGFGASLILLAAPLSLASWYIATARPTWGLATLTLIAGVAFSVLGAVFGTAVAVYVTLSDNVSGFAGVAINGKTGRQLARGARWGSLTVVTCLGVGVRARRPVPGPHAREQDRNIAHPALGLERRAGIRGSH